MARIVDNIGAIATVDRTTDRTGCIESKAVCAGASSKILNTCKIQVRGTGQISTIRIRDDPLVVLFCANDCITSTGTGVDSQRVQRQRDLIDLDRAAIASGRNGQIGDSGQWITGTIEYDEIQ